jgi:hypothetical protein
LSAKKLPLVKTAPVPSTSHLSLSGEKQDQRIKVISEAKQRTERKKVLMMMMGLPN